MSTLSTWMLTSCRRILIITVNTTELLHVRTTTECLTRLSNCCDGSCINEWVAHECYSSLSLTMSLSRSSYRSLMLEFVHCVFSWSLGLSFMFAEGFSYSWRFEALLVVGLDLFMFQFLVFISISFFFFAFCGNSQIKNKTNLWLKTNWAHTSLSMRPWVIWEFFV